MDAKAYPGRVIPGKRFQINACRALVRAPCLSSPWIWAIPNSGRASHSRQPRVRFLVHAVSRGSTGQSGIAQLGGTVRAPARLDGNTAQAVGAVPVVGSSGAASSSFCSLFMLFIAGKRQGDDQKADHRVDRHP